MFAAPALADGIQGKGRISSPESRACSVSGSVGVASENMFRGVSKSFEDASIQGGVELSCGRFYVGVAGASAGPLLGTEIDYSAGFRTSVGKINVDVGGTYYTFEGARLGPWSLGDALDFAELKVAASTQVWKGGTVSGSVAYAFDYFGLFGDVATYEVGIAQALPKVGIFSPTVSANYGYSDFLDASGGSYAFWNVGVTVGFLEKWSLDLRYHDTDGEGFAALATGLGSLYGADSSSDRFVATLKYSF
jgi:uncharacterized protein (TIGR02001 family)